MSDIPALRQIADKAAAETLAGLGYVTVGGRTYRTPWAAPGKHYIQVNCILCADTGVGPKDDPAEPDQPCDCVRGAE